MTWAERISGLRNDVVTLIDRKLYAMVGWTLTSSGTPIGDRDGVEKADGEKSRRTVRRLEPWGLRSVPVAGVRMFWMRIGSSNVVGIGLGGSKGYGPQDLDQGETALYNLAENLVVKLTKDGTVELGAAGLSSSDGVVHGSGVDPFTGLTYETLGNASSVVLAKKD